MAGLRRKDRDFWNGLEEWDVVVMSEMWVEEARWGYVERRLPRGYIWERQWARREKKKGRAIGGMRVRKGAGSGNGRGYCRRWGWWTIVGVYVNGDLQRKLEDIGEWMEEREWGVRGLIIGGDFNARTGEEGAQVLGEAEEEGRGSRRSKDRR